MDARWVAGCALVYQSTTVPVRTTVTIDDDILELARAQARASGMRLGKVLSLMARRGLESKHPIEMKNGLPVIRNPTNEIIPADRVRKILHEEMW